MNNLPLMNSEAEQVVTLLKALAHPERLNVMCQLIDGEKGVTELWSHSHLSQSAFSQQLSVLRQHHLVRTRKHAQQIYYSLESALAVDLLAVLKKHFCSPPTNNQSAISVATGSGAQRNAANGTMLEHSGMLEQSGSAKGLSGDDSDGGWY